MNRRRHASAGFALPIELLLTMAAGLVIALLMRENITTRLAVQRHVESYRAHHERTGLQEIIGRWMATSGSREGIGTRLDDDGLAFTVEFGGAAEGDRLAVYFFDAQGTVLRDVTRLTGKPRQTARGIVSTLEALLVERGIDPREHDAGEPAWRVQAQRVWGGPWFRVQGELAVSVNAARREVLEAVAQAVLESESDARRFLDALEDLREEEDGVLGPNDITVAAGRASLRGNARDLRAAFTARPELWGVLVELRRSSRAVRDGAEPVTRWASLLEVSESRRDLYDRSSPFLAWERLEPGPDGPSESGGG